MAENRRAPITAEILKRQIKGTISVFRGIIPENAEELKNSWDELDAKVNAEDRIPVLFAMYQTLREVINEDLPDDAKQDVSFPVELEEGKTKVYKSYKEFLNDCQRSS